MSPQAWRDQNEYSLTWRMLESNIRRCISSDRKIEELDVAELAIEELKCGHVLCEGCVMKLQKSLSRLSCHETEAKLAHWLDMGSLVFV